MRCFASTDSLSCQSLRTFKCIYLLYFPLTLPYWGSYSLIQGPRSKFLSGGAKLDEIFFGGGMLRNFYLISLK